MKTLKKHKRRIPVLVKEELDKITHPRKDNLYCIVDLVYRRSIHYKSDEQKEYGYIPIPSFIFSNLLGKAEYTTADINFLIEKGIIFRNDYYSPEAGKCKSYKIASELLSRTTVVVIQSATINRKITEEIERMRTAREKRIEFQQSKYYKNFKLDVAGAKNYLFIQALKALQVIAVEKLLSDITNEDITNVITCKNNYQPTKAKFIGADATKFFSIMHRLVMYSVQVDAINDGYLYFKRDKTGGRLHTNLTSLPADLRPFIISSEELYSIDIKSSQPFFLYTLVKDEPSIDKTELDKYKNLVTTGDTIGLYEYLQVEYENHTGKTKSRDDIKKMLMKIFYSKNSSFQPEKKFFSMHFKTINRYIEKQKEKKYNDFAILLQNIESKFVLDLVLPRLKAAGIVPYTIHDSFVCNSSEVDGVVSTLTIAFNDIFNVSPNLHIDCISLKEEAPTAEEELYDFAELIKELENI